MPRRPAQRLLALLSQQFMVDVHPLPCQAHDAWLAATARAPPTVLDDAQLHGALQWLACADTHARTGTPSVEQLVTCLPDHLQRYGVENVAQVCENHYASHRDHGAAAWLLAQATAHTLLSHRLRTANHGGPAATLQALHQGIQSAHRAAQDTSAARPAACMMLEMLWSLEQGVAWLAVQHTAKGALRPAPDAAAVQFFAANSKV